MHHRPEREAVEYWRDIRFVSDAHSMKNAEPKLRPSYRVGDLLVIYLSGTKRCPAIVRVTATAEFDPARVDREARPGDGRRWGWVTDVEPVAYCTLPAAPTIDDVGIDSGSLRRRSRLKINPQQYHAALSRLTA